MSSVLVVTALGGQEEASQLAPLETAPLRRVGANRQNPQAVDNRMWEKPAKTDVTSSASRASPMVGWRNTVTSGAFCDILGHRRRRKDPLVAIPPGRGVFSDASQTTDVMN
jgi:hypothetical protein